MDDKKKKIILTIATMLLVLVFVVGITYSITIFTGGSDQNSIKSGKISMSYKESSNVINLTNALPITDEVGKNQTNYFDFSITSNADTNADDNEGIKIPYNLIIEPKAVDSDKDALTSSQIKVYLTKVEGATETQVLAPTKISALTPVESNFKLYNTENVHKNNNGMITTNYRLRAWIDYGVDTSTWNQTSKAKQYKFGVNVNATGNINTLSETETSLAIQSTTSSNNTELWKHKRKISKIVFQNELKEVPNTIESWDLSEANNGSVMGYLTADPNDNTKYIGYIQGDNEVIANEDSSYLFYGFTNLKEIEGLEYFNTSNAKSMMSMFDSNESLTSLDLSSFDTSNVTEMRYMFYFDNSLTSLDLSSFNTSKVTDMSYMFCGATSLTSLNLSSFDTSNVTKMHGMFNGANSLTNLDFRKATFDKMSDEQNMFQEQGPNINIITKNATTKAWLEKQISRATITTVE